MVKTLGTIFAIALATVVQPTAKPDFSGEWKMVLAKSDFGAMPPPTAITRSITHTEPALTIIEVQESQMGTQSATRKYVTDGSPSSFESMGATVASSAKWEKDALLVVSNVDAVGLTFHDRMMLSADGKTLTSQVRVSSPQGDVDVIVVFEKQ